MSTEHDINVVKPGSMLTIREEERQELLEQIDRKLAELDEHQDDAPAQVGDSGSD